MKYSKWGGVGLGATCRWRRCAGSGRRAGGRRSWRRGPGPSGSPAPRGRAWWRRRGGWRPARWRCGSWTRRDPWRS